jgi:hypothetical protein
VLVGRRFHRFSGQIEALGELASFPASFLCFFPWSEVAEIWFPVNSGELTAAAMVATGWMHCSGPDFSLSFGLIKRQPSDLASTVKIRRYPFAG